MKALFTFLILILVKLSEVSACAGYGSPEIQALIELNDDLEDQISGDVAFSKVRSKFPAKDQKTYSADRMVPINFKEPKHHIDYQVLGDIEVPTFDKHGKKVTSKGSAIKIGKSCILTSAHTLYRSLYQSMSEENNGQFTDKIRFNLGLGTDKKTYDASVFFQMTKKGVDYIEKEGKRVFYGHHDLVVLKLNSPSNDFYRKVSVLTPQQATNNANPRVGKEMSCHGSPYYKTSKTYGSCKGSDFRWKQEKARIFEEDKSSEKGGMSANVASGPGMSGGPCYLDENPNKVFALVSNGYHSDDDESGHKEPIMPNIQFDGNYAGGDARYVSLFNVLNQRMKNELGYGLDEISEKCK